LRYFNAAGADIDGQLGENHEPETHLIPLILQTALGKRENVKIFGTDYDTPDGTCIRDYIHVCDLAEAHILALKALENGLESTAYNLSTAKDFL
jgi:UDP-glucose 4-epimerase